MRSLFVKLFLWFWFAMTLSGVVFFLLAFNMRLRPMQTQVVQRIQTERRSILTHALSLYGRSAAADFEREGRLPSPGGLAASDNGMEIWLFDSQGTPLLPGAPPPVRDAASRLLSGADATSIDRGQLIVAVKVQSPREKVYLAVAQSDLPPPPPPPPRNRHLPPGFWIQSVITFIVGGVVCYGLAWHLASPVRRLREAAQKLSAGDLSVRVELGTAAFKDEIKELGGDFNIMADRIEKLVTAQKVLVRDVSHELRSPLARLTVALGLARRNAAPEAAPALDRIEQEADRLNQMIGELLTLTQLESGYQKLDFTEVDIDELVRETAQDAAFEAASSGTRVVAATSGRLEIRGHRELLRRALENVVRNAIHYTKPQTEVEIRLEQMEGNAVITVKDCGPGVPQEALANIFRPFYRVAEARDRRSGGTGIGLAITAQTTRLHGGQVSAKNLKPTGLEVELRLPIGTPRLHSGPAQ